MEYKILNLTQHQASAEQMAPCESVQGAKEVGSIVTVEPTSEDKELIKKLLTFQSLADTSEMRERAKKLAEIIKKAGYDGALIGGAPYFMPIVEQVLFHEGVKAFYAFSVRESKDLPDGRKVSVFKHAGYLSNYDRLEIELANENYIRSMAGL